MTAKPTLVEKMARVLYAAESSGGGTPWEECLPGYRECMLRKVRPILAVVMTEMREPSEGMVEEGWKCLPDYDVGSIDVRESWRAMLAAFEKESS